MNLPHLRVIRKQAILSQEELAAKSGVARDTISKLETGRRKAYPSTIRKLAGGLEIAPQMLMGGVQYLEDTNMESRSGDVPIKDTQDDGTRKVGF